MGQVNKRVSIYRSLNAYPTCESWLLNLLNGFLYAGVGLRIDFNPIHYLNRQRMLIQAVWVDPNPTYLNTGQVFLIDACIADSFFSFFW